LVAPQLRKRVKELETRIKSLTSELKLAHSSSPDQEAILRKLDDVNLQLHESQEELQEMRNAQSASPAQRNDAMDEDADGEDVHQETAHDDDESIPNDIEPIHRDSLSPSPQPNIMPSSSPVLPALVRNPSKQTLSRTNSQIYGSLFPSASSHPSGSMAHARLERIGLRPQASFQSQVSHHPTPDPSNGHLSPPNRDQDDPYATHDSPLRNAYDPLEEVLQEKERDLQELRDLVEVVKAEREREKIAKMGLMSELGELKEKRAAEVCKIFNHQVPFTDYFICSFKISMTRE